MIRECLARVTLSVVAVVFGTLAFHRTALAEPFDKPLRKTVVNLGRSTYLTPDSRSRVHLSCFYYPAFMVKELNDPGLKGAEWIAIAPITNSPLPTCRRAHNAGERLIGNRWSGYFRGVKGQLLFLDAEDGDNGGMPFGVFNWKTLEKLFQDSVSLVGSASGLGDFDFSQSPDGNLSMRYLRVVAEDCSIPKYGVSCWNKFRQQFGLALATPPTCTGYAVGQPAPAAASPPEQLDTPSAISYPVIVDLLPRASIKPTAGAVKCWPVD